MESGEPLQCHLMDPFLPPSDILMNLSCILVEALLAKCRERVTFRPLSIYE
jgi:hypothetical protein